MSAPLPEFDLPAGIGQPATRALGAAGITRLDQVAALHEADLLKMHGVGPKAVGILRAALQERGLAFAGELQKAAPSDEIFDNPTGWVKAHIQDYVQSGGQQGHLWRGLPTLLLITRGRKSGVLRRTALIYGQDGGNYLVVASNGGSRTHPAWYLNLSANPQVELQVGAEKFPARAHTATPAERQRLWERMSTIFPQYDKYQAKTKREIPLIILEPA